MTVVPCAAIDGRSACTDPGLMRIGLPQSPACDDAGDRRTKTPMRGPLSSAHRPDGGGQSDAKMVSSLFDVAASDLPGSQAYGDEMRRARPNEVAAAAGVAIASTAATAMSAAVAVPRMRGILAGVASGQARVPEPVDGGGLNPPAPSGACGFESHPGHRENLLDPATPVADRDRRACRAMRHR